MDVKFTSLIVYVINQIILLKGATESRCARGGALGVPRRVNDNSPSHPHTL